MIKVVFFDVDGTLLLSGQEKLSNKVEYALKQLNKKGIMVVITTGRGPLTAPNFHGIKIDGYITFNGAYSYFNDLNFIIKNPLNKNSVNKIIDNARKLHKGIAISNESLLLSDYVDNDLIEYFKPANEAPKMVKDLKDYLNYDIYQVMIPSSIDERKEILKNIDDMIATSWCSYAADYVLKSCSKGIAIKKVLEHFKIKKDEAMAFGDGMNDISMFNEVKYSIAMGDANEEVKKSANEITDSALNDGVYTYLKKIGIID